MRPVSRAPEVNAGDRVRHGNENMAWLDGLKTGGAGSGEYSEQNGLVKDYRERLQLSSSGLAGRATEW